MDQNTIFAPFFAQMFLTFLVWVYMYSRRIPFIVNSRLTPDQMTPAELARLSPPAVSNPSDNLKNLFEIPTLFFALVLYLFVTQHVDGLYVAVAWVFVAFRVLHSLMHCTANIIIVRFWLYAISTLALWFMLGRAALAGLGAFF